MVAGYQIEQEDFNIPAEGPLRKSKGKVYRFFLKGSVFYLYVELF
jgi:hypothetical protein